MKTDSWMNEPLTFGEIKHPRLQSFRHMQPVHWQRQGLLQANDFSGEGFDFAPFIRSATTSRYEDFSVFTNVHLIWLYFLLDGHAFSSYSEQDLEKSAKDFGSCSIADWAGIKTVGNDVYANADRLSNAQYVSGRTLYATSTEPHNWGLFLTHTLPVVVHFLENRLNYDQIFVLVANPSMKEMLRLVGLHDKDMIVHDAGRAYRFESLAVFRPSYRDLFISQDAKESYSKIKTAMGVLTEKRNKIFISRKSYTAAKGNYRGLINEPELCDFMSSLGFMIVEPETLSVTEQVQAFASASHVAGLGGAGMFNTVFCPPRTAILDIESTSLFINAHANLFDSLSHRFAIILGVTDPTDTENPYGHKRWSVPIPAAEKVIRRFLEI